MSAPLIGLTWDHPRGYNALAAAAIHNETSVKINWKKQPLEGFESSPIADLCARYDLVVLDHPHLGEAIESNCLLPLEEIFEASELVKLVGTSIGPSARSYAMNGNHWAVPLNAATQVSAWRCDLIEPCVSGFCWDDISNLSAETGKVALSLAGPHALLSYFSILASMGKPADPDCEILIDEQGGRDAYELMVELAQRTPRNAIDLNPIGILEHMSINSDIAMCPLIYGYVNYADRSKVVGQRISFSNAPAWSKGGMPGSTLGGTGIAVSRRCPITPQLKAHLLWLMSEAVQTKFIPHHQGQPSSESAWADVSLDHEWSDFYSSTFESVSHAYVRPRYNGYISFQTNGSQYLRASLFERREWREVSNQLQRLYQASLNP
ncbi:carbohydrate ABC transporter substrate-binding protein [Brucella pseudogrignonensis]|uniref:carbohydrate ABC transporter substrate-binding protein n=1 Tax=Brucella pseudogrignonensis TaxID=419475 RepID=UPI001E31F8F8|nr:carbohydrate ABC transporter substrate-binding protein [Brucella pseudogrignonensis]MCD4511757.1 carbohydrate ABC transporter substrate-binding protein [Brucella pseudogrignonensis]